MNWRVAIVVTTAALLVVWALLIGIADNQTDDPKPIAPCTAVVFDSLGHPDGWSYNGGINTYLTRLDCDAGRMANAPPPKVVVHVDWWRFTLFAIIVVTISGIPWMLKEL